MKIGIDESSRLIYETSTGYGYPLWPSPMLLQVVIASEDDQVLTAAKQNDFAPNSFIFREDTYNSSSRIRRGRLYRAFGKQPDEWHVYPHPALADENPLNMGVGKILNKSLFTFSSLSLRSYLEQAKLIRPIFLLGADDSFTVWTLVNIERSATGDELIVLRGRKSIGALPHLDREKITKANGKSVLEYIDKLEEELYRASPESVIDRAREAATAILSKYLQNDGKVDPGKDLGDLANLIEREKKYVVANAARIIARFHARGKHAEQEQGSRRPITEQDAEFSVQAVGIILCDLDWATW